jgi:hypothetical protein
VAAEVKLLSSAARQKAQCCPVANHQIDGSWGLHYLLRHVTYELNKLAFISPDIINNMQLSQST